MRLSVVLIICLLFVSSASAAIVRSTLKADSIEGESEISSVRESSIELAEMEYNVETPRNASSGSSTGGRQHGPMGLRIGPGFRPIGNVVADLMTRDPTIQSVSYDDDYVALERVKTGLLFGFIPVTYSEFEITTESGTEVDSPWWVPFTTPTGMLAGPDTQFESGDTSRYGGFAEGDPDRPGDLSGSMMSE
ncbi:MAG: hypothetical protein ACE5FT_01005 [Candidatus Nanoarchaeia archaeon]